MLNAVNYLKSFNIIKMHDGLVGGGIVKHMV